MIGAGDQGEEPVPGLGGNAGVVAGVGNLSLLLPSAQMHEKHYGSENNHCQPADSKRVRADTAGFGHRIVLFRVPDLNDPGSCTVIGSEGCSIGCFLPCFPASRVLRGKALW